MSKKYIYLNNQLFASFTDRYFICGKEPVATVDGPIQTIIRITGGVQKTKMLTFGNIQGKNAP
jgi:hypothetical protein